MTPPKKFGGFLFLIKDWTYRHLLVDIPVWLNYASTIDIQRLYETKYDDESELVDRTI